MKTSNKFLALAIGMAAAPGVMALELSSVGAGFSPVSTFAYSDGYKTSSGGVVPSLNADFRITGPTPLFLRAGYMREGGEEPGDVAAHVLKLAILYQWREAKTGVRPYAMAGMAHIFTVGGEDEPPGQTTGLVGVGVRHTIAGKVELDLGYSALLGQSRIGFLTAGLNYKF